MAKGMRPWWRPVSCEFHLAWDGAPPMPRSFCFLLCNYDKMSLLKQVYLADVEDGGRQASDSSRYLADVDDGGRQAPDPSRDITIMLNERHSFAPLRLLPLSLNVNK
eukprot:1120731-Pleurochrysis_carterae.AAC.2